MLSRVLVTAAMVVGIVGAASVVDETAAAVAGSQRDSKLFPVVQLVTFENAPCEASNGEQGTCYSQKECENKIGVSSGTCANGFGVCCVLTQTCDGTITTNGTYFQNPGYPSNYSIFGMCLVTLVPPAGTCQILLEFMNFELVGPWEGDCTNDTFVVVGANKGIQVPVLCGSNTGQHMYIDVDNSEGPFKLVVTMSSFNYQRRWKIKVSFLEEYDNCMAPKRCLQYLREPSGIFNSFNYVSNSPEMLNWQEYAICFAYIKGFCDIGINFQRFDLGNVNMMCEGDLVAVGHEKICGDYTPLAVQANSTGPIIIKVQSDDDNSNLEEGFAATYVMMPC